ncbi:DNA transposase THAP9 [Astyanax mexicanus]|uniref:DNA transposase THAP9 n=1 Tax=Astyanax mexicanus TaxID=7994 RepID=A0A8T2LS32_ASTMX|nr:DNA transposase THAP9 [Astyanax mexicanus]
MSGKISDDLRSYVMTLHFYSEKAYQFVRKSFNCVLPHPETIRSWYSNISAEPGFTQASFSALQSHVEDGQKQGKDTICALMLDEMAIRKHVEYAEGKFYGYVDVGCGKVNDSLPVAKDALVLMVVAINGSWKIPVGYFLIDGLSGQERANLINQCLHKLHAIGVCVVSLTCDGPSCHFSMMQCLGASITAENMRPLFPHPSDQTQIVHVVFDGCHMLKLLRNCFAEGGVFQTGDGTTIKWQYIEELNKVQEAEGLRLGNKLKMTHILWRKHKMKVNLAAQVFSSSVADALEFCNRELHLPQFRGCEATVEFIRTIDCAFDVLNTRNPLDKGFKAPLRPSNKSRTQSLLENVEKCLLQLRDSGGKLVHKGPRKTGAIGFIASCRSIFNVFQDLVEAPGTPCKYLLTYKLSQDHLGLFFSAIRARGGYNNSQTV